MKSLVLTLSLSLALGAFGFTACKKKDDAAKPSTPSTDAAKVADATKAATDALKNSPDAAKAVADAAKAAEALKNNPDALKAATDAAAAAAGATKMNPSTNPAGAAGHSGMAEDPTDAGMDKMMMDMMKDIKVSADVKYKTTNDVTLEALKMAKEGVATPDETAKKSSGFH